MKMTRKNYAIKRLVSVMLALSMIFAMVPATVFADDTDDNTQTIYIGGNKLTVPLEEATYWKYNEGSGEIAACTEQEANVLINTVGKYGAPIESIYVNLVNVSITAKGGSEDPLNAGIYNPEPETRVYLRINGDCSVTGSKYGIYAKIDVTPCDAAARLTITADSSLAPAGVDVPQAVSLYSSGANYLYRGCEHTDFSVILRSNTMTTLKGGGDFTCQSTKASLIASPNMDGSDATEYFKENGIFNLGDMSRIKYREYKNGTLMYDKAKITGATLRFQDGDAPVFTAQVAEEDNGKYYISSEQWSELDENGNKVKWCSSHDSENPRDESQLLKTFEAGKTYYYSITVACQLWDVSFTEQTSVIINGEAFTVTSKKIGEDYVLVDAQNVKSMTVPKEIKKIEVANATLSYKAGDAPKATAALTGENAADYRIAYECWEEMEKQDDGSLVPVRSWYSDAEENAKLPVDKKIIAFEKDKTYTYSIKLKTVNENYFADIDEGLTMTLNGETVSASKITVSEGHDSVYAMALKTITLKGTKNTYKFLEGENGSWTQGSDGTLRFRVNGDISKFTGVKVDGIMLSADQYTVESGSMSITLKAGYLKGLSVGTHKITVVYTDGECSANFGIKRAAGGTTTEAGNTTETTTEGGKDTTEATTESRTATTEGGKDTTEATTESGTATTAGGTTAASDNGAGTTATTNAPKTGDESCPWMYMILLIMACGGMAGCRVYRHNRFE